MKLTACFAFALVVVSAFALPVALTAASKKTVTLADYPPPKCWPCPTTHAALN